MGRHIPSQTFFAVIRGFFDEVDFVLRFINAELKAGVYPPDVKFLEDQGIQ